MNVLVLVLVLVASALWIVCVLWFSFEGVWKCSIAFRVECCFINPLLHEGYGLDT